MDILEQLFIRKYSREHTLIQAQIRNRRIPHDAQLRHAMHCLNWFLHVH
jgi:hypothetical protein